jgi:hypothetical protein
MFRISESFPSFLSEHPSPNLLEIHRNFSYREFIEIYDVVVRRGDTVAIFLRLVRSKCQMFGG